MKTLKHFLASFLFALSVAVAPAQTVTNVGAITPAGGGGTSNVNLSQVNGTTTSVNDGLPDAGTIRVTQAGDLYFTGQSAQTATVNNIIPTASGAAATDVSGFESGYIQVVSTGTGGTFIFEGSNDNSNFQTIPVYNQATTTGTVINAAITASATQLIYTFPVQFRYIRLRIATTITGGSIQAFSTFKRSNFNNHTTTVAQATGTNANVAIASGTVTTVSTVTTLANGQTAHSSASTGSPVRVGGRVNTTLDTTLVQGDASDVFITSAGQAVDKPYGTAENDWLYAPPVSGISNTTTAVTIKAAGAANIRNYITDIQISADTLGAATELAIRDGAAGTVIWRIKLQTTGLQATSFHFTNPLRGSAATLMEVVTLTASVSGSVYVNAQGYQSF